MAAANKFQNVNFVYYAMARHRKIFENSFLKNDILEFRSEEVIISI